MTVGSSGNEILSNVHCVDANDVTITLCAAMFGIAYLS